MDHINNTKGKNCKVTISPQISPILHLSKWALFLYFIPLQPDVTALKMKTYLLEYPWATQRRNILLCKYSHKNVNHLTLVILGNGGNK